MKINDWLEAVNWTQGDLVRHLASVNLPVSRSAASRWCSADPKQRRVPGRAVILKIQELTKGYVKLEDWG